MPKMCNHKNSEGRFIIACDSDSDITSDEMYCVKCGRSGNRIELEREGDFADWLSDDSNFSDEMCAAEAIDIIKANYPNAKKASLVKAIDFALELLEKEAERQANEPPIPRETCDIEDDAPHFILVDQPYRLYELP